MKRMLCLLLALALVLGIAGVQVMAVEEEPTEAVTETVTEEVTEPTESTEPAPTQPQQPGRTGFVTSEECVALIKQYEGFCKYPVWDYGQYTVGYGTRCPDDKLAQYRKDGITEEEAEALLREFLMNFEDELNSRLIEKHGLKLTQNQFDAILSFSYNCGTAWIYDKSGTMYNAIVKGITGNELVRSFALWCSAGGEVLTYLMQRRLAEANMYLNGVYNRVPPSNFCYVLYNANGGTTSPRTQGYDSNYTVSPYPVPKYAGYNFAGWYTERVGGTKVTTLTAAHNTTTLYAHWVNDKGESPFVQEGNVTVTVTGTDVNVRSGPGTNYTKVGTVTKGDKLVITETTNAGGYNWGKFTTGWIALQYTNYDSAILKEPENEPETTEPTEPEVTPTEPETQPTEPEVTPTEPVTPPAQKVYGIIQVTDSLNVRSGPGTGYAVVGKLGPKERVEILEQKTVGSVTWAKISSGWISMQYVKLESTTGGNTGSNTGGNTGSTTTIVGTGTIVNCNQLRIRSGPGTNYDQVGYLDKGTKVSFTEFKTVGSVKWGKMDKGWISLDYVKLDDANSGNTTVTAVTGTVNVEDFLRVRSGPGTSYAISGYLKPGQKVTITEQKTVGSVKWGKTESGWISMQYVKLDSATGNTGNTGDTGTTGNTGNTGNTGGATGSTVTGIINVQDSMNVRSGPGTSYSVVGKLKAGATVTITELKTVSGVVWGKISNGWISMQYVKISQQQTEDVRTVNATTLYVRKTPGNGTIVGYLYNGAKVTILETKTVDGRQWGRISSGWICLDYTKK